MIKGSADTYVAQQLHTMSYMITDPEQAQAATAKTLTSDRPTIALAAKEMILDDLSLYLAQINVPVLVLTPAFEQRLQAEVVANYTAAYKGTPQLEVKSIFPARHFLMLDQPSQVNQELQAFLKKTSDASGKSVSGMYLTIGGS